MIIYILLSHILVTSVNWKQFLWKSCETDLDLSEVESQVPVPNNVKLQKIKHICRKPLFHTIQNKTKSALILLF